MSVLCVGEIVLFTKREEGKHAWVCAFSNYQKKKLKKKIIRSIYKGRRCVFKSNRSSSVVEQNALSAGDACESVIYKL